MKKRLVFTTFLALVAALALQVPASETSAHGPPPEVRPVYLALGDSLAFGIGASDPATTGYVPLFYDDLRSALPDHFDSKFLMLENLAVGGPGAPAGGETTTTMIAGGQLDAALAELTARNNNPRPVDDVRVMVHLHQSAPDNRPCTGGGVVGAFVTARMVRMNHDAPPAGA